MKKLIAKCQVRYMGQVYERGEAVPASDSRMVAAWLRAGSAAWKDVEPAGKGAQSAGGRTVNDMAADALRAMGVIVEDDAGEFVGAVNIEDQIRVMFGPGDHQDDGGGQGGREPTGDSSSAQNGQETQENGENGQGGEAPAVPTGHLDPAQLERMTKADLLDLAEKLGVDVSAAKNQGDRARMIAEAGVLEPAGDPGGGE